MSLNLETILELLKQHVSPAAQRVPKGWEIIAREAHRQGVIDGRAIQLESAAGASERADAEKDAALTDKQLDELIAEHSEWTPQGFAIVDTHRWAFARAILSANKEKK